VSIPVIKLILPCWAIVFLWPGLSLSDDKKLSSEELLKKSIAGVEELLAKKSEGQKELDVKTRQHFAEWRESLAKGRAGRFRCMSIAQGLRVFILDTKEGQCWLWALPSTSPQPNLKYIGQVYPSFQIEDAQTLKQQ